MRLYFARKLFFIFFMSPLLCVFYIAAVCCGNGVCVGLVFGGVGSEVDGSGVRF